LAGSSLILAPLLLLLGNAIDPAASDKAAKRLPQIASNEGRYVAAAYLLLVGAWAFVPAVVGLWRLLGGGRVTLGQAGAGLMLIGAITTIAFFGFGIYEYEAAQPGRDPGQMARLADAVEKPTAVAIPLLLVFVVGMVLGSLLVAWSLWRRKVVPPWSPAAIAAGSILNFFANGAALSAGAFALLLVGFGWVGLKLLGMSGDDWDRLGRSTA
jgi:hypothetical protein